MGRGNRKLMENARQFIESKHLLGVKPQQVTGGAARLLQIHKSLID